MSLGPVMVDIEGIDVSAEEREMLRHPMVGGVILFARNYSDRDQLRALTRQLHDIRSPRLLIAVDQEGGRVQRFRDGFTHLPAIRNLGMLYDKEPGQALHCAQEAGWLMAQELLCAGVDISFAPVVDLDLGVSQVIGDRAFHRDPEVVGKLGLAYIRGMREAGMAAVAKHFPGHGGVAADSHHDLPRDGRSLLELEAQDLKPFAHLIRNNLPGIMMAHVVYESEDSLPASFSAFWIETVLREQLGFQGMVFSDDLNMAAAESLGDPVTRARQALSAGCDMVLICNNPPARDQILETVYDFDSPLHHLRLVRLHGRAKLDFDTLHKESRWCQTREMLARLDPDPLLDMDLD